MCKIDQGLQVPNMQQHRNTQMSKKIFREGDTEFGPSRNPGVCMSVTSRQLIIEAVIPDSQFVCNYLKV